MTTLIPDSWELPSYLAGDVVNMDRYRDRGERATVPDKDWAPGQNAKVIDLDFTRAMKNPPQPAAPAPDWDVEPYDPSKHHEPAELYNQNDLDALHAAGYHPTGPGAWRRSVTTDKGENLGAAHTIFYEPGHRQTSDGRLIPWHVMTNPDGIGTAHPTLHGPEGALTAADAEAEQIRRMPRHSRLAAAQSPGRANADDWLERNTPESFEEDPRAAAHDWMDQNADQYEHWEPETGDYTYPDVGDASGWQFGEHGDARPTAMPGHFQEENAAMAPRSGQPALRRTWDEDYWNPSGQESSHATDDDEEMLHDHHPDLRHQPEYDEDDEDQDEQDVDAENLTFHGFNWEPNDPNARVISPETPGKWVRKQHDLDGNHVATHTIHQIPNGSWRVDTELGNHGLPVTFPTTLHGGADWALGKYKQNSAEAMLPRYGYEPVMGRANGVSHWVKTDPSPEGHPQHEDYQHEISFPEHGFLGQTENNTHLPNGASFAPNGNQAHNSEELADVVREQQRLAKGIHPGGRQDYRLTPSELHADPTVARLGRAETVNTPWGDRMANRMTWSFPTPGGYGRPVNAEANYNWNTGNYDFKYTHDGSTLAATHNYVPDGAPVTIPGRQTHIPLESAR